MALADDVGAGFRFELTIDGVDIGSFSSCEGLAAEYEVTTFEEGGENGYEHRLRGALRYTPIRLSRPIDTRSQNNAGSLASWFSSLRDEGSRTKSTKTAAITARAPDGTVLARWSLLDAYPFRWTGPSFSVDGSAIVTETLELAHHGFID
jgi:phage tail-like protein